MMTKPQEVAIEEEEVEQMLELEDNKIKKLISEMTKNSHLYEVYDQT